MTALRYREGLPSDAGPIIDFQIAMARETEDLDLDRDVLTRGVDALFSDPSLGRYFIADLDGRAASSLMITYEWSDWRNGVFWWLQSVYVDPPWRRRGVFRRLHNAVMASAQAARDVCGVRLYVDQDNQTAQTVYQHLGLSASAYRVYEQDFVLTPHNRGQAPRK